MGKKFLTAVLMLASLFWGQLAGAEHSHDDAFHEQYQLVQMVVVSRHNIRAPLVGPGSSVYKLTSHRWHDFGVAKGELTVRGGEREQSMGRCFRWYLQQEGLFAAGEKLTDADCHFYANAFQRTIATARNFAQGLSPSGELSVQYIGEVNDSDPVFLPGMAGHSQAWGVACEKELAALGGEDALTRQVLPGLQKTAAVLGAPVMGTGDLVITAGNGLHITGPARPYMKAADALTLQYYEQSSQAAGFGHELSFEDWRDIAAVKDLGIHLYRNMPTLARAQARPLLTEIQHELDEPQHKFTFLCGHDTNIASILGALLVKNVPYPDTIEQEAPIGSKIVMEKWQDKTGQQFIALKLVYPTTAQLQGTMALDEEYPPQAVPLHLQHVRNNKDGLMSWQDFQQRLSDAIASEEDMLEK